MGGIGIVNNPRAARNRRHPETRDRLARLLGTDGEVRDADTPEALAAALAAFRAAGVDTLGINGGDGTSHVVLTAAVRAWAGRPLPRLLVLRGGTMNTLAANHDLAGSPERVLHEVLAARRSGRPVPSQERDLLRVEADREEARFGFLFGTGAAVTFLERYYATGHPSPLTAWLLVARGALSALVNGKLCRALTVRQPLRVEADGEEWPDASYVAFVAGTVPSLGLGFRALSRCAEQPGSFHAVGVHGSLGQVARLLPRVHRGAPWRRRAALDAVAREVVLEGDGTAYMIDGDLFPAARRLRLSTGPGVTVLRLPGRRAAEV
jgi:diacylglycerol kinase family enzyme